MKIAQMICELFAVEVKIFQKEIQVTHGTLTFELTEPTTYCMIYVSDIVGFSF